MTVQPSTADGVNGRLSPDEWHDRFLEEHEVRMRRVDEALEALEALVGRNGSAADQAPTTSPPR